MRLRSDSLATRFGVGAGLMVLVSLLVVAAVFYLGTIGVLGRSTDRLVDSLSTQLLEGFTGHATAELVAALEAQLRDGTDSDSEVLLLLAADGRRLAGNLPDWPHRSAPRDELLTRQVNRRGTRVDVRFVQRERADGTLLVVGRDLREQESIRELVLRALLLGCAIAVVLGTLTASAFRRHIDRRIGRIRRAALDVGHRGDLSGRVLVSGRDEFARLGHDINRMLDRVDALVDGVRHVSNAIAHDLRTPLSRLRGRIDPAVTRTLDRDALLEVLASATMDIDDLIALFERLLQIAEVESGVRAGDSGRTDLAALAADLCELYEALADASGVTLRLIRPDGKVPVRGDRGLLANAVANLLDNAVKHAGRGSTVTLEVRQGVTEVVLEVHDDGPGVPEAALPHLAERFFRVDSSRGASGHGLGLATVAAVVAAHDGRLEFRNRSPGLAVRITLAAPDDPRA
jgi:signal transduction histidine kinase